MTDAPPEPPRRSWLRLSLLPLIIVGVLGAVFLFELLSDDDGRLGSVLIGRPAPATDLPPLAGLMANGEQMPGFSNADFLGQVTVVNVFASWCGPCHEEHPELMELSRDDRFRMVGLNYKDPLADALAFLNGLGNPYDAVGVDVDGRTAIDWGVYGVPETFIVDRAGVIRFKHAGPIGPAELTELRRELDLIVNEISSLPEQTASGSV